MAESAAILPQQTDEQLVAAFARGHDAALGELAQRYEGALVSLARGITGRDDLASDAVQDAWLRVIRSAKHFDGRSSFKTWVYRIVINRCLDVRASAARATTNGYYEAGRGEGGSGGGADGVWGVSGAFDHAAARERLDQLRDAMRALEPGQRVIVMLCYQDRVGHEAAAQILGIPVGTLKSRLHGALETLRAAIARTARTPDAHEPRTQTEAKSEITP